MSHFTVLVPAADEAELKDKLLPYHGRITNPNAKWDWWTIGGRWSGLLKLKPGVYYNNQNRVNFAYAGDVDIDELRRNLKGLTFAFIDLEGKWNQWGVVTDKVVTDKDEDYDGAFWRWWEYLPTDVRVYVVDCHI